MKGEILMRELSTGDVVLFGNETKNLFLIGTHHVSEWKNSSQSQAEFNKMLEEKKIRVFTEPMLRQLHTAVQYIDFKI